MWWKSDKSDERVMDKTRNYLLGSFSFLSADEANGADMWSYKPNYTEFHGDFHRDAQRDTFLRASLCLLCDALCPNLLLKNNPGTASGD
jgi:hypothetical protein